MNTFTLDQTVAELVTERPARSRVFNSLGIDFCCGGKKTLQEVCDTKQIEPARVLGLLQEEDARADVETRVDFNTLSLSGLIDNIVETHHAYLREELPQLGEMLGKVSRVHGDKEPRLREMLAIYSGFCNELSIHMMKEERVLFPAIAWMERTNSLGQNCFASVAHPIAQMESEHGDADEALAALRGLSDGFTPPDWACNTYRATLDGLRELEANMHQHVHKENNILFPKAIRLEETLRATIGTA